MPRQGCEADGLRSRLQPSSKELDPGLLAALWDEGAVVEAPPTVMQVEKPVVNKGL